ncbi:restriction endonuclease [Photorhabdus luminescens]|uniref:Restriction endonuclease n=1 Tax=Photorhabdus akhurstii TaxID=171438 RepID=A0ABX8LQJ3_9GAMM|nr:restriction endonuclease subunit S [Photorhabdus akhurstii]QXF32210.1 restriction endonuclease [Photorhabdus akhurstii]UJD74002.1 restriction endonuclease [Photorhabdus luminescens]
MSNMSFMEKLLDGVEVEWKTLGELTEYSKTRICFDKLDKSNYVGVDNLLQNWAGKKESTYVPTEGNLIEYQSGDILIGNIRPYLKKIWHADRIGGTNGDVLVIHLTDETITPRYLYQILADDKFFDYNMRHSKGAKMPRGNKTKIMEYPIPIPSLNIQTEIVRILDAFTELTAKLTAKLTAELTARKKQYNYYRDQFLSFEESEVEWKTLDELAKNLDSMRKPITSGLREPGEIPYYGASGIVDYVKDYIFDGDFLLVSEDGANLVARNTPIAFSISGKSWVNNHAHVLKFETYAERKYVEYYLNSIDLTAYISGAAQPKLNKKNLNSISIPNPSPEEKERIVSTLDKFDALTSSISEGLPREIELRQKQYEYYRDLLLSFPKPEVEA